MRTILDDATDPWGIKVNRVELKNILPPKEIQNAMEKQMKAERERREAEAKARAEGGKPAGEEPQAGKQAAAVADPSAKSDKSETAEPAPVAPAVAAPETE